MSLCIPYPVLEGVIEQLSAQHIFHGSGDGHPGEPDKILKKMQYATVPANVILGGTSINIQELVNLQVGDVILLDREVHQDMLMCVNGKPKFFCRPGTRKDKLAACISEPVGNVEALEGFGLTEEHEDTKLT